MSCPTHPAGTELKITFRPTDILEVDYFLDGNPITPDNVKDNNDGTFTATFSAGQTSGHAGETLEVKENSTVLECRDLT